VGQLDEVEPAIVARGDVQKVEVPALEALRHNAIFVLLLVCASFIVMWFFLFLWIRVVGFRMGFVLGFLVLLFVFALLLFVVKVSSGLVPSGS
jgi:hypothetical protein